jgi:hypothetical protein
VLGPAVLGPAVLGPAELGPAELGPAVLGPAVLGPAELGFVHGRVVTSLVRGRFEGHELVCECCGSTVAWAQRPWSRTG